MHDEQGDYLYGRMRGRHPEDVTFDESRIHDLGHDMKIMLTRRSDDGPITGFFESHKGPDGVECSGSVTFDMPENEGMSGPRWTLHSLDPLHIEPSVLCGRCGWHGFVRNGRWEPV
jgi:hypothetical protein